MTRLLRSLILNADKRGTLDFCKVLLLRAKEPIETSQYTLIVGHTFVLARGARNFQSLFGRSCFLTA